MQGDGSLFPILLREVDSVQMVQHQCAELVKHLWNIENRHSIKHLQWMLVLFLYHTALCRSNILPFFLSRLGNKPTPEEYDNEVMAMLKEHAKNKNGELRVTQPDLVMK